jgi:vacuolar-type H+-ATPase subunit D/Vma8
MTIDERLEALAMHLEVLTGMHEDLKKRRDELAEEHRELIKQMKSFGMDVKDVIRRLGVIAEAHSIQLDDHDRRLDDLESNRG